MPTDVSAASGVSEQIMAEVETHGYSENAQFAKSFWWSARTFGKTDERLVTMKYFFSFGLKEFFQRSLGNLKIAIGMVKTGRMHIGMPHSIKDKSGLKAILAKAAEIEERESKG